MNPTPCYDSRIRRFFLRLKAVAATRTFNDLPANKIFSLCPLSLFSFLAKNSGSQSLISSNFGSSVLQLFLILEDVEKNPAMLWRFLLLLLHLFVTLLATLAKDSELQLGVPGVPWCIPLKTVFVATESRYPIEI